MDNIKKHMKGIIISSIICLVPIIVGLIFWNKLPDMMPAHFDINNNVDRYDSKMTMVVWVPLLMFAVNIICILSTLGSSKSSIPDKFLNLLFVICPAMSIVVAYISYAKALGAEVFNIGAIVCGFLGVLYIALGNYMPKLQPNHFAGVRMSWTYKSTKNWQHTNRIGGWIMFISGIVVLLCAIISGITGNNWINIVSIIATVLASMIVIPLVSFTYYKKHKDEPDYYDVK